MSNSSFDTFLDGSPELLNAARDWIVDVWEPAIEEVRQRTLAAGVESAQIWSGEAQSAYQAHVHDLGVNATPPLLERGSELADLIRAFRIHLEGRLEDLADVRARAVRAGLTVTQTVITEPTFQAPGRAESYNPNAEAPTDAEREDWARLQAYTDLRDETARIFSQHDQWIAENVVPRASGFLEPLEITVTAADLVSARTAAGGLEAEELNRRSEWLRGRAEERAAANARRRALNGTVRDGAVPPSSALVAHHYNATTDTRTGRRSVELADRASGLSGVGRAAGIAGNVYAFGTGTSLDEIAVAEASSNLAARSLATAVAGRGPLFFVPGGVAVVATGFAGTALYQHAAPLWLQTWFDELI